MNKGNARKPNTQWEDLTMTNVSELSPLMPSKTLIAQDVREYFKDRVSAAINNQKVSATEDTIYYIVNLLAQFVRADALFERTPDGISLKPLALIYIEALEAQTRDSRHSALRRLGDVALLISGMFSASLKRKLVSVDYYIGMGGCAYECLFNSMSGTSSRRMLAPIFGELASKFQLFVDVLTEVSDGSNLRAPKDVMHLYEVWARTGSQRTADQLRRLGIEPLIGSVSLRHN